MPTSPMDVVESELRLRCRSHPARDLAMVAAVLLLVGAFVAHALDPVSPATYAAYAAEAAAEMEPIEQLASAKTPCVCE